MYTYVYPKPKEGFGNTKMSHLMQIRTHKKEQKKIQIGQRDQRNIAQNDRKERATNANQQ